MLKEQRKTENQKVRNNFPNILPILKLCYLSVYVMTNIYYFFLTLNSLSLQCIQLIVWITVNQANENSLHLTFTDAGGSLTTNQVSKNSVVVLSLYFAFCPFLYCVLNYFFFRYTS